MREQSAATVDHYPATGSLEQLLVRAGNGDQDAFALVYDLTVPDVLGLVCRFTIDDALANDIVRDVFVAIWRASPLGERYRGWAALWILVLTHNCVLERLRAEDGRAVAGARQPSGA